MMAWAIAGFAAASVAASMRDLPMIPATPVMADPTAWAARRREGVMRNPSAAAAGMAAVPPSLNSLGVFRTDLERPSSCLHNSSSSSIPPLLSRSMHRAALERRVERPLTAMSPALQLWAVKEATRDACGMNDDVMRVFATPKAADASGDAMATRAVRAAALKCIFTIAIYSQMPSVTIRGGGGVDRLDTKESTRISSRGFGYGAIINEVGGAKGWGGAAFLVGLSPSRKVLSRIEISDLLASATASAAAEKGRLCRRRRALSGVVFHPRGTSSSKAAT
mmetsp:Transcript_23422/g.69330  ORF Transcript_23422/g.69330 Transcript_23422/m.69330 type:complete len:279 (-) Transcript_23422:39-875(-)